MEFLTKFNDITLGKYNYIRVQEASLYTKKLGVLIKLLVPYDALDRLITDEDKDRMMSAIREVIPARFAIKVEYVKSYVDNELVKRFVIEYFKLKHPTIYIDDDEVIVKMDSNIAFITVSMKSSFYDYFSGQNINKTMTEYMSHKFCNDIKLKLVDSKKDIDIDADFANNASITVILRKVNTSDHVVVQGKTILEKPKYIVDCHEVEEKAVYAGVITDFKRMTSKRTDNSYYIITISDGTGSLICKAFTKYTGEGVYDKLQIGDEIIARGRVELDTFLHDSVLLIRDVSKCVIDRNSIVLKEELKEAPKNYVTIIPTQYTYETIVATDLFGDTSLLTVCPKSMMGKTFVVFDFETTGLSSRDCEVIEIGAVKVVDGVITEVFSSFVDPEIHIPERITEITSITDADVSGAPTMAKIIGDFYKFSYGAILVAHNAPFDKGFLDKYAKANRFLFDNRVVDTLFIAKRTLVLGAYKLGSICNYFGVSLEGAHRAVNDCEATAKILIKLAELGGLDN